MNYDDIFGFGHGSLFGMKVITPPQIPKMQLSEDCPVSPEFRKQCNAWMIEFFGYKDSYLPLGTAYIVGNRFAVMHPSDVAMISNIC